jgi:hypothetical protein
LAVICTTACALVLDTGAANAQTPVEYAAEARFQLDIHLPDAALASLIPPGFTVVVATQGNAKDANVRLIFMDRMTVNGPDGKPIGKGSSRVAYFAVPVRDASGANAQLIVAGMSDNPADVPGPFGVYLPATVTMTRSTSNASGMLLDSQDWVFQAPTGERLELHVTSTGPPTGR